MKLTDRTLSVLKNFASINNGVVLRAGKVQKTLSADKAILAEVTLDDDFANDFGIYDLNRFLGNVTTLTDPDLTFTPDAVTMDDGTMSLTYYSCVPSLIITPPNKELALQTVDVSFVLTNATLSKLLKLAAMNSLPNLSVIGKNGELRLQTHERSNDTSNYAFTKIGDYVGKDFSVSFKTDNLKLLPDDYDVELQIGAFAKFVNKAGNLKYFVALESK